jgi:hypothetical protein
MAMGTVTPGVQVEAPTAAQLLPMLVVAAAQSVPLQQRLGRGPVGGLQVRPAEQAPRESQIHPLVPAMQVDATLPPEVPPPTTPPSAPEFPVPPLPPHTLGTPPQPQHCGAAQVPH